jgi:YhgE/Pip N-terminal domain/YhgE/Pip C-terminal domain
MSNRLERLFGRTRGQRRWRASVAIGAAILVPIAVVGIVAGALGNVDQRTQAIPAVVVNDDAMVTTTTADGSKQPILAGRQLVTELTGKAMPGFDWSISNDADAAKALSSGGAYAVLTIPKNFSASIASISGTSPKRADISIRTDDAHSYLAGSVAQSVGGAMTSAFGTQVTEQYLAGLYGGLGGMGDSLQKAADGATSLTKGSSSLASGLDSLARGASSTAAGSASLASGVQAYTGGVDALAGGLRTLSDGAASLDGISSGLTQYAGAVDQASSGIGTLADQLAPVLEQNPQTAPYATALLKAHAQLQQLQAAGASLRSQAAGGIDGVQAGISRSADAATQLSAGSAGLRQGAAQLARGSSQIANGAKSSATGAHALASGASKLAGGLATGAEQASRLTGTDAKKTASVVAQPVAVRVARDNPIASVGPVIGMTVVPIGLWVGALVVFLLLRPVTALNLASTSSTMRLVFRGLARAGGIALAQAIALTALLHGALGVPWGSLPATLAFLMLLALVFTAVHHLFAVAFGRGGVIVSIVLLALQLTTVMGLFPSQLVAQPFQAISGGLPLTYAVAGMQSIVSGVGGSAAAGPAVVLMVFGAVSVLLSYAIVARRRGARAFGFAIARARV